MFRQNLVFQKVFQFTPSQHTVQLSLNSFRRIQSRLLSGQPLRCLTQGTLKPQKQERRRLDVAIVGLPNAGKSQLLNVLTESNVAAVSRKRHTTRDGILGARTIFPNQTTTDDNDNDNNDQIRCIAPTQLVFVDTPGFLRTDDAKEEGLDRDLMVSAKVAMEHVDYTLLVVDSAKRLTETVKESIVDLMLQALLSRGRIEVPDDDDDDDDENIDNDTTNTDSDSEEGVERKNNNNADDDRFVSPLQKFAVVLNKVDLIYPKSDLIDIAVEIGALAEECIQYQGQTDAAKENSVKTFDEDLLAEVMPTFFYVSAKKRTNVKDVLQYLVDRATPCTAWEMEPGESSLATPEERVEEVIREKLFRCLHKEVPYSIEQETRMLRVVPPRKDEQGNIKVAPKVIIHQELLVQTKSHQTLVYGKGKQTLEQIRSTAERDLIKHVFKCPTELHIYVKLKKSKNNPDGQRRRTWSI